MTVYGLWWGGPGYSLPAPEDLERFANLATAKDALKSRYDSGGYRSEAFDYVQREPERLLLPVVTALSEIHVYLTPDADLSCPLWRVYFGPRDGVRVERC